MGIEFSMRTLKGELYLALPIGLPTSMAYNSHEEGRGQNCAVYIVAETEEPAEKYITFRQRRETEVGDPETVNIPVAK